MLVHTFQAYIFLDWNPELSRQTSLNLIRLQLHWLRYPPLSQSSCIHDAHHVWPDLSHLSTPGSRACLELPEPHGLGVELGVGVVLKENKGLSLENKNQKYREWLLQHSVAGVSKLWSTANSLFVHKILLEDSHSHLLMYYRCCCFQARIAELGSYHMYCVACQPKIFTIQPFRGKVCGL